MSPLCRKADRLPTSEAADTVLPLADAAVEPSLSGGMSDDGADAMATATAGSSDDGRWSAAAAVTGGVAKHGVTMRGWSSCGAQCKQWSAHRG